MPSGGQSPSGMQHKVKTVIEKLAASAEDADSELTEIVRSLGPENRGDKSNYKTDDEEKGKKTVMQLLFYCRE